MDSILTPHFDLPLRLRAGSIATVEQDSYEDIANCVETILRTPQGERNDSPNFGRPALEFENQPLNVETISAIVTAQEPRAALLISQRSDLIDPLIATLVVEVG